MDFLIEHLDVIIGAVVASLFTAIGYGWKERSERKKEKRDRDRKYLDEYNEVLADYEDFYKTYIEDVVFSDVENLADLDQNKEFAKATNILKRMVVLETKATILEDIKFETYLLLPRTAILSAKKVDDIQALELYKEAVRTLDDQLINLRSQVKEAYKKLD